MKGTDLGRGWYAVVLCLILAAPAAAQDAETGESQQAPVERLDDLRVDPVVPADDSEAETQADTTTETQPPAGGEEAPDDSAAAGTDAGAMDEAPQPEAGEPPAAPTEPPVEQTDAEPEAEEGNDRRVRRLGDFSNAEEWDPDFGAPLEMAAPDVEVPDVNLPNQARNQRLQDILVRLAIDSEDAAAQAELNTLLNSTLERASSNIQAGRLRLAEQQLNAVAALVPEQPGLAEARTELETTQQLTSLLGLAQEAQTAGRLVAPENNNAAAFFRQMLELDPENQVALTGLTTLEATLLGDAQVAAESLDFETAQARIAEARSLGLETGAIETTLEGMSEFRTQRANDLQASIDSDIAAGNYDAAEINVNELVALGGYAEQAEIYRGQIADGRLYAGMQPGEIIQDQLDDSGTLGPAMVVMPVGDFMMGSDSSEEGRSDYEGPVHRVDFARGFSMAQTEVTVSQFRDFISATGYRTDAERIGESRIYDEESGRLASEDRVTWEDDYKGENADDDQPVIHVSWNDAEAYAAWLAETTGQPYRLPSEAEFEYALRSGSSSTYWWGNGVPPDDTTNVTGTDDISESRRRWTAGFEDYEDGYWGPAPVASFAANPFGLYDMAGNVSEWTADCWHASYAQAPSDGTAWVNPGCNRRVVRGGSWSSAPNQVRSAFRVAASPDHRGSRIGFRVARTL